MGTGVPLLNEYKQVFLFKRIPQTVLGGLKLRLGYDAPAYVYFIQIILWLVPWLLGIIFTLVLELAYSDDKVEEFLLLYSCLYGACIIIFVVVIQTITTVVQMKEKENLHAGIIQKKKNILAEEDEVEFESCCGAETLGFVIPPKKFKMDIILHGLLSGLVCGIGFWYLLPYSLNQLFGYNYGATATIYIIGWITVSIAQYSLTSAAPPEPAVYRTMDVYELLPLTRPFYTFMCYSIHIVYWYHDEFKTANQVIHVVFILLPLLWFSGLLPPAEMVFLWLMEQFLVFILGGSPTASNLRLLIQLLLSTGVFFGCYYIPSTFIAVVFAAVTGYILSIDLGVLASEIVSLCDKSNKNRVSSALSLSSSSSSSSGSQRVVGFLWSWRWSTLLYHCFVVIVVGGVAAAVNYHSADIGDNVVKYLGYVIISLFVMEKLLRDFQTVFVGFGMFRNPFYPKILEVSSQLKKRRECPFVVTGVLRRCLIDWICPLVMTAYLSLIVSNEDVTSNRLRHEMTDVQAVFFVFGVVRSFRSVWQSTTHALLEMSVIHIIVTEMSTNSVVEDLQTPTLLLIAGIVRDRLQQFINKVYFVISLIISSWMDKKQRRSSMTPMIILNILFFPILLSIIILASLLSAPLLPMFTLPLFFIGYPRHNRFWPEPVGQSASTCGDSMYYKQLSTELARGFRSAFATGSLGEPEAGNHYMVRYQDRLVWCLILERGAGYCTLSIKGLELQETSCHTAEAARIDEQFEEAFEPKRTGCCNFNSYPLHCLTPLDAVTVKTYSDAKNVLTGVIDSPDSANMTLSFFTKTLVWVLLHHVNKVKKQEEEKKRLKEKEIAEMERENSLHSRNDEKLKKVKDFGNGGGGNRRKDKVSGFNPLSAAKELGHNVPKKNTQQSVDYSANVGRGVGAGDSFPLPPINNNRTNLVQTSRPSSRESNSTSSRKGSVSSSLHSFTDSIWSDDFNPDKSKKKPGFGGASKSQPTKMSTVVSITNPSLSSNRPQSPLSVLTSLPPLTDGGNSKTKNVTSYNRPSSKFDKDKDDMDDFLDNLELGLPAVDVNASHGLPNVKFDETCGTVNYVGSKRSGGLGGGGSGGVFDSKPSRRLTTLGGNHIYKPVMNLASSPDFTSPFSSRLSIPSKWRELPIESSQLTRYLSQFPTSWYKHTLSKLDWTLAGQPMDKVIADVTSDDALTTCYTQLVMACYSAFDTPGRSGGASFLYKCYHGEVQWNAMMDWLSEDKELLGLVLKAFRYSFKLMLDQTLLGDISDDDELEEYLASYDDDWYIGKESDPEWGKAVLSSRPNLFSLGHNLGQNTYTSRTLSIQELPVYIGRLNAECVRGQWSNLNMELLYMTNDDEERYSIQALPAMLRNLTVQAADPPLGYPVYSSPPISVPTI